MSLTRPFLLGPVFFRTDLSCSGGHHLDWGGMPLHDAVGINCKNGATKYMYMGHMYITKYMGYGVYVDDCVCVI